MVLDIIGSDGKRATPIFTLEGRNVNAVVYQHLLSKEVIPWIKTNYEEGSFVFQQDWAPVYAARSSQKFVREYISFWSKDLNLLDFFVCGKTSRRGQIGSATQIWNLFRLP